MKRRLLLALLVLAAAAGPLAAMAADVEIVERFE